MTHAVTAYVDEAAEACGDRFIAVACLLCEESLCPAVSPPTEINV